MQVVDNTYEYFVYNDDGGGDDDNITNSDAEQKQRQPKVHECIEGNHVINVFSFSKAYGLMGWRVGYFTYPAVLDASMVKVRGLVVVHGCIPRRIVVG